MEHDMFVIKWLLFIDLTFHTIIIAHIFFTKEKRP